MGAIRATCAVLLMFVSAVASAADCATGVRILSTRANVPNLVAGPSAWNGTGLAVAKTQEGALGPAWVAVYGEGLETLTSDRLVAGDARELIALVWTGAELGLFYRTTNQRIHLLRLTSTGELISTPVVVTPGRPVFTGDRTEVIWSAVHDAYVVARYVTQGSARGLYLTMLEEDGSQRSDRPILVDPATASPLAIDVTDAGVIGVFFNTSTGFLAMARITGSSDTPEVREVVPAAADELVVAARAEQFVVARTASVGDQLLIRWLVVDTAQRVAKSETLLVEGSGQDVHPQALVVTPDEIALSYMDSPIRDQSLDDIFHLRRFTITGDLIGDIAFAPTDLSAVRAVSPHPFTWTGTSYLAPPVRSSSDRLTSYLVRYCPLEAAILAPRTVLVGETVTFTPVPGGGVPGYTYVWTFSHQAAPEKNTVTPQRTYTEKGTYSATVTVTDNAGVSTSATVTFDVVHPRRRAVRP